MSRNFYGTMRVKQWGLDDEPSTMRKLVHGVIKHGEQFTAKDKRDTITSYYGEQSGIGYALDWFALKPRKLGFIGLGVGTLSAYGRPEDVINLYEINPQVVAFAKSHFWYLPAAQGKQEVMLGDARLVLEQQAPQQFDVLAIDAFSSDSIPTHLITREALAAYQRHMKPGGVIAFHVTNRYLRLAPVVKQLAEEAGMRAMLVTDDPTDPHLSRTDWVLVTKDPKFVAEGTGGRETKIEEIPGLRVWTDDFNNLLQILKR
jgi:hypothetical protein